MLFCVVEKPVTIKTRTTNPVLAHVKFFAQCPTIAQLFGTNQRKTNKNIHLKEVRTWWPLLTRDF